jgi:hypothetical protein
MTTLRLRNIELMSDIAVGPYVCATPQFQIHKLLGSYNLNIKLPTSKAQKTQSNSQLHNLQW